MDLRPTRVLVAGAATAGSAVALLLARAGARVTLCERVAEPRALGAGIALAPNGLAVLAGLGLAGALAARGRRPRDPRIVDARGRVLLRVGFEGLPDDLHLLVVRRADLQETLLDAVAGCPAIDLRLGTEVSAAAPDGTARLCGPGGVEETGAFDLVVGADGVGSRVRDGGRFGARTAPSGIEYVRGLTDREGAEDVEAWTGAGLFGSFAVPGGTYFFSSCGAPELRRALAGRDLPAYRAVWNRAYPPAAALLAPLAGFDELLVHPVIEVRCRRFHDGRCVLAGDAAHAMAPNLGQGANSALVDAAVLADELRRAPDLAAGLAAYTRRRRPPVGRVQRDAARLGRLAEATTPAWRWVRDRLLLPLAGRLSGARSTAALLQEPVAGLRAIAGG